MKVKELFLKFDVPPHKILYFDLSDMKTDEVYLYHRGDTPADLLDVKNAYYKFIEDYGERNLQNWSISTICDCIYLAIG